MAKQSIILTPEFRLSFCNLFIAKADMNGLVRFQMEMLFPKDRGGSQFKEMQALYNEGLANAKWSAGGPEPRSFKDMLRDGNAKKQEGRHGMWMVKANSGADFPPAVKLQNGAVATPSDVYEGCWCRAVISTYSYESRADKNNPRSPVTNRGIAFNMRVVQKVRDDQPFSSYATDAEVEALLAANALPSNGDDADLLA